MVYFPGPNLLASRCSAGIHPLPTERRRPSVCRSVNQGKCWLVGSGPGPVDYLTVKATRILSTADVVIYDDLASQDALNLAPPGAKAIYVGKRGGKQSSQQLEINDLIVEYCKQGLNVVRLKGGCPSVFSRVASEITALATAGCNYELVPGVSSILAAPLMAGFPLTDLQLSPSFAVVSGHDVAGTDWPALSRVSTLVVLMGGAALPKIVEQLKSTGWQPDTPVVIVRGATTPDQRIWRSSLEAVVEVTRGEALSPCIIIVGQVTTMGQP